jgi:hypothetical protein
MLKAIQLAMAVLLAQAPARLGWLNPWILGLAPWRIALAAAMVLGVASSLQAEELKVVTWRGEQALLFTGDIENGTAARFAQAIAKIAPSREGSQILLLDSGGGLVGEAFAMSDLMDKLVIHTVIPDGAKCASSCASIVFIAGKYRTVEAFGLLGQHSCSLNGVPDQHCNDKLSENAVGHGVSYGSISAFVTYTAPKDILWFSREDADGWGITRYAGSEDSGFEKSEPRVIKNLTGKKPAPQSAWRIDFREDGYRAFLRPYADDERELQLNLFCEESLRGRIFASMEIHGPASTISDAILRLSVTTDAFAWEDHRPLVWQADRLVSEVITEVPRDHILDLLTKASTMRFDIALKPPYKPIWADALLESSRKVLLYLGQQLRQRPLRGTAGAAALIRPAPRSPGPMLASRRVAPAPRCPAKGRPRISPPSSRPSWRPSSTARRPAMPGCTRSSLTAWARSPAAGVGGATGPAAGMPERRQGSGWPGGRPGRAPKGVETRPAECPVST